MSTPLVMLIAALLIGLSKGGFNPVSALIVPFIATRMPVADAIGLALPLLIVGDWSAMPIYWRQWDTRHVRLLMLPAAVIGVVLGLLLLTSLSDDALRRILGIFTLVIAAYKIASDRLKNVSYTHHDWHGWLAGGTGAFASALANAGGPPITAYLLLQRLTPVVFVATNMIFFAAVNLMKLPFFLSTNVLKLDLLQQYGWVAVLIPVGVLGGRWLIERINRQLFEWIMLAGLVWAGVSLLAG